MRKVNLNLEYWEHKIDKPNPADLAAINDAFKEYPNERRDLKDDEKQIIAELLLASCMRFNNDKAGDDINTAVAKFDQGFAVEPMFYACEGQLYKTWRYSYADYVKAIPKYWSERAIRGIYERLGVELDDEEVQKIYRSNFLYSSFFSLVKETLTDRAYFKADCKENFRLFEQISFFNMWHLFDKMGFEGLSPFEVLADIGVLTPPSSQWKPVSLTEAQLYRLAEIRSRTRGRDYPSCYENIFLIELAGV